jgi:hypothetical protein
LQESVKNRPHRALGYRVDFDSGPDAPDQKRRHVQSDPHRDRRPIELSGPSRIALDGNRRVSRASRRILGPLDPEGRHEAGRRHLLEATAKAQDLGDERIHGPARARPRVDALSALELGPQERDAPPLPAEPDM